MKDHNHALGIFSSMETIVTASHYYRKCRVCGKEERLKRAGKLRVGYSLLAEQKRDFERREYAKDLLQPKDTKGATDELFDHAWGNPYKETTIGQDMERFEIAEEK